MATLKTRENNSSVSAFLERIPDRQRRDDALAVAALMTAVTKSEPKMWGPSIVGFGSQHYRYTSGREGEWFRLGFSPRKEALTLYIPSGFETYPELMAKLGKYKIGKSCLHLRTLADVDQRVLEQLLTRAMKAPLPGAEGEK